jgi:hypothetical protein
MRENEGVLLPASVTAWTIRIPAAATISVGAGRQVAEYRETIAKPDLHEITTVPSPGSPAPVPAQ